MGLQIKNPGLTGIFKPYTYQFVQGILFKLTKCPFNSCECFGN